MWGRFSAACIAHQTRAPWKRSIRHTIFPRSSGCRSEPPNPSWTQTLTDAVHHSTHLIKLLRADVGAVGEAKVHEAEAAEQVLMSERVARSRNQAERPANARASDLGARRFGLSSFLDLDLLVLEIEEETGACDDEEDTCTQVERLRRGKKRGK